MPMGNDPTPIAELESAFGVTSSAEELVKQNHQRYTDEQRAGLMKPVNETLNADLQDDELGKLEDELGHEVIDAVVRGSGASAIISYTFVGPRDSVEKDYVPYADVYGDSKLKKRRKESQALKQDPAEAGQAAAAQRMQEADREAAEKIAEAQAEATRILEDAKREAQEAVESVREEVQKIRDEAVKDAPKAAEKASEQAAKDKAAAAKSAPKRTGDGAKGTSGTGSGRQGASK
jgi:hypothetical protein